MRATRVRRGFTLIEMTIAMTLLLLVFAIAVPFFRTQARAVENVAGRSEARQNVRYAVNAIDRELRVAGVGVLDAQPMLVLAGPRAVTFNADLVSRDQNDVSAVSYDPDADAGAVSSMLRESQITLPGTTFAYPDTNYTIGNVAGGPPSHAETITYWVERDTVAGARPNQHTLYRRANATTPQVVARGILLSDNEPIFRYLVKNSQGVVREVPLDQLPLIHRARAHGSAADQGALIDSVVAVRVKMRGLYRDLGTQGDSVRSAEATVRIVNAGLMRAAICGAAPRAPTGVDARYVALPTPRVRITWSPSTDEAGGEMDVERYVVYRRRASESAWREPLWSGPGGLTTYSLDDTAIQPGDAWVYGIAAQDCTPQSSGLQTAATVNVP